MLFSIATHAYLFTVEIDENWSLRGHQILKVGHHYGTDIIPSDRTLQNDQNSDYEGELVVFRGGTFFTLLDDMQYLRFSGFSPSEYQSSIPIGDRVSGVHQVIYANDGLYIANTDYNSILFQGLDGKKIHEYFFNDYQTDINHINSIFPYGDFWLALLHNRGKMESQLVVLEHDIERGFSLVNDLSIWHGMCHNIFVDGHHLFYNASSAKSFVVVDLLQERVVKELPFPHQHTKGMSVTDDYIVIGLSDHTLSHLQRHKTKGYLAVIDRHTWELVKTIDLNELPLPEPVGNINDIRCLSEHDYSHFGVQPTDTSWIHNKLARRNLLDYSISRAKYKMMIPLRQAKRRFERRDAAMTR